MKIEFQFNTLNTPEEIFDIKNFFQHSCIGGVRAEILSLPPKKGTMSGSDLSDILCLILSSTVTATLIQGCFDTLRDYFKLKRKKENSEQTAKITIKNKEKNIEISFDISQIEDKKFITSLIKNIQQ